MVAVNGVLSEVPDAIRDGTIIRAGELQEYAGEIVPVYFTRELWDSFVKLPVGQPIAYADQERINRVIKALDDELLARSQKKPGLDESAKNSIFSFKDEYIIDNAPATIFFKAKSGTDVRLGEKSHRYFTVMLESEG